MNILNPTPHLINNNIIEVVENHFGCRFPSQYRDFIIGNNGGKTDKSYFLLTETDDISSVKNFFGVVPGYESGLVSRWSSFLERIPSNMIAIASSPGGNLILLSVKGPDHGKIYFWDHERETEPADYSNLTLIADSFDEFINNLKSEEEIEELEKAQS